MTQRPDNSESGRPELLAGYVDGELGPADRATIEAWLAEHPAGRAELEAQRALSRQNVVLWKRVAVPQPSESAWNKTLGRVCDGIRPSTPAVRYHEPESARRRPGTWKHWAVGLATAVALAFVSWSWLVPGGVPRPGDSNLAMADVFAVASNDDVDIESLQGDIGLLVVGRPVLGGPIELATVGDIVFEAIASDTDLQPSKPTGVPTDPKKTLLLPPIDKSTPVPVP